MAYIRRRGKQLVLAHGQRNEETGKVEQQILFTLYSKAEAKAAVGESAHLFKALVEREHPMHKLNWKQINKAIQAEMDVLPDVYTNKSVRVTGGFRQDLCVFTKRLMVTDPQDLDSSAAVLDEHRRELEYLRELIDWRLKIRRPESNEFMRDDVFYWRFAMRGAHVPPEVEEHAADLYGKRDFDQAEALFKLLIDCFDDYAEGYNYLGLIALDRERFEDAIAHFEKTVEVGRTLFPNRIGKSRYWSDHDTRSFMRGRANLASALNQAGRFEESLVVCNRLATECGHQGRMMSEPVRASVLMNIGRFREAAQAAKYMCQIDAAEALPVALALSECRDDDALVYAVYGLINFPRAARMLLSLRSPDPKGYSQVRDHNAGVYLTRSLRLFLKKRKRPSLEFLARTLADPRVAALSEEHERLSAKHAASRELDREAFDRMTHMAKLEFAEQTVRRWRNPSLATSAALH